MTPPPQQPAPAAAAGLNNAQIAQLLTVLRLLGPEPLTQLLCQLDPRVLKAALFQLNLKNPEYFPKPAAPAGPRTQFGMSENRPSERELGVG